jgi:hypothetical protein
MVIAAGPSSTNYGVDLEQRLASLIIHMNEIVDEDRSSEAQAVQFFGNLLLMWADLLMLHSSDESIDWMQVRAEIHDLLAFDESPHQAHRERFAKEGANLRAHLSKLREALEHSDPLSSHIERFFPEDAIAEMFGERVYIDTTHQVETLASHREELKHLAPLSFSGDSIKPNPDRGISLSYILKEDDIRYLIKLDDTYSDRYHTVLNDALCYQIALRVHLEAITPETSLALINACCLIDKAPPEAELLVSAQRFVEGARELGEFLQDLQQEGLSDEEIGDLIDQTDFEEAWLFERIIGDTDGHFGNFLVYVKDPTIPSYGIQVIDNSFTLHDSHERTMTFLPYLPNAQQKVSDSLRAKVHAINVDEICEMMDTFHKAGAKEALIARVYALKQVIDECFTIAELNTKLNGELYEIPSNSSSVSSYTNGQYSGGGQYAAN